MVERHSKSVHKAMFSSLELDRMLCDISKCDFRYRKPMLRLGKEHSHTEQCIASQNSISFISRLGEELEQFQRCF